jgi:hypothetical protein
MKVISINSGVQSHEAIPKYAALSYVWGEAGKHCLNLHMGNLQSLQSSLLGHAMPIGQTIQDAIVVTKRLSLQYLWVDSLCVVQRHEFVEDDPHARASQIEQMDRIYGHASITIAAAGGQDANSGLPGISTPAARNQIASEVLPNINVLLAINYSKTLGKWDTRAWTLQEKLLSKRMLIFNGGYVSFHCRHGVLREDMPADHAANGPAQIPWVNHPKSTPVSLVKHLWDGTPALLRSPFFSEYAALLAQYTSRDMTDSRDALNAVLGLLKVLEKMSRGGNPAASALSTNTAPEPTSSYTLYGLPEEFLDLALMWQPPAAKGVHLTKRTHDDLPSWSWAGWQISNDPDFDPNASAVHLAKPGVRFEEPFWVSANDDLSLKKVIARGNDAEDRFRPLIMWYKCLRAPSATEAPILVPVNGHGIGLALGSMDTEDLRSFRDAAIKLRTKSHSIIDPGPPFIPSGVPIDSRHLICQTQIAKFRLRRAMPRKETLWKRSDGGLVINTEMMVFEAEILDETNKVVGRVVPTDPRKGISSGLSEFMLLSESQFYGNEDRVDISGYPMYNVMFLAWDSRLEFATRLGVGKIAKVAWEKAGPSTKVVILK